MCGSWRKATHALSMMYDRSSALHLGVTPVIFSVLPELRMLGMMPTYEAKSLDLVNLRRSPISANTAAAR